MVACSGYLLVDAVGPALFAIRLTHGLSEAMLFASLFATEDRAIGMASFIESGPGKATFTGSPS